MKEIQLCQISGKIEKEKFLSSLCEGNILDVKISYESYFSSARILREFIDAVCKKCEVSPKWRTRLVLIIDELNNNAIEYGSAEGDENFLYFHLEQRKEKTVFIRASVSDTGRGKYPRKSQDMEKLREKHEGRDFSQHQSIRGRGLFLIISHLVDTLSFRDNHLGGLTVGIEKLLGESSQTP